MACWCLLQAAGARQLRPLSNLQSGPLGFTNPTHRTELHSVHPQQRPQTSVLRPQDSELHKLLQLGSSPPPPTPTPTHPHHLSSSGEPIFRTDSLNSIASSASFGPHTPSSRGVSTDLSQGRQTAVPRYEPHRQPSQMPVVSQTAEGTHSGRGRSSTPPPSRGTHGAELAHTLRQPRQPTSVQSRPGFEAAHVKPLVGEVMIVDDSTDDDTHVVFSKICSRYQWRFYTDVRGDLLNMLTQQ